MQTSIAKPRANTMAKSQEVTDGITCCVDRTRSFGVKLGTCILPPRTRQRRASRIGHEEYYKTIPMTCQSNSYQWRCGTRRRFGVRHFGLPPKNSLAPALRVSDFTRRSCTSRCAPIRSRIDRGDKAGCTS
jgi:hypothetical protein